MNTNDIADVAGKNVVITGAAKGIGFAIAKRMASAGANCLLVDIDSETLEEAAAKLALEPGTIHWHVADLAQRNAPQGIADAAVATLETVDVLVNNAGIFPMRNVLDMTEEFFEHVLAVNLSGLVFLSKEIGSQMRKQGDGGKIINIVSIDAVHPSMTGLAAYDASKGAVLMFTKNFALEMAAYGVQVNAVAPGAIATEGASAPMAGLSAEQQQAVMADFIAKIPVKRIGQPDDIAKAVQFLASTGSDYMTGSLVTVDGGRLLG